jgi:Mor family transcriptional regulator
LKTSPAKNVRDILPKSVLTRLQRYCTGLVYVPAPISRTGSRRQMILRLQKTGMSVDEMARTTRLSTRWVRHIVAQGDQPRHQHTDPKQASTFLKLVPPDLAQQVQRYVTGRLYIPSRRKRRADDAGRIGKLFDQGLAVKEIASRVKLSERHVYRLKKAWSQNACRRQMGEAKESCRSAQRADGNDLEPRVAPKLCQGCGRPISRPRATYCDPCSAIHGDFDGDVIVPSPIPWAPFDPKF